MGNNCCDKANTNAKNIEALQASASSGSDSDIQTQIASLQSKMDSMTNNIGTLTKQVDSVQAPTVQAITSVINNDPEGQIATAITKNLGKNYVTKGLLGLDNSNNTLTFNGNMVLKCSSASGKDCLTVQGAGSLASAKQWKAGSSTPSPGSSWTLGSDGNIQGNNITAQTLTSNGALDVKAKATFENDVDVKDLVTTEYLTVNNTGNGAFEVKGLATFDKDVSVTGQVNSNSLKTTDITSTNITNSSQITNDSWITTKGGLNVGPTDNSNPFLQVYHAGARLSVPLTSVVSPSNGNADTCPFFLPNSNNAHDCIIGMKNDWASNQDVRQQA